MSRNPDELVAEFRKNYPDLTEDEERHIREAAKTGGSIFFRCTFENDPRYEFTFGEPPNQEKQHG